MSRLRFPPDGSYPEWQVVLAARYPLTLPEMRNPSVPVGTFGARALARWGIECHSGWRQVIEALLEALERAILAEPVERRHGLRIVQLKEKFGRLTVHLASEGTVAMKAAIASAEERSVRTCEVCSAAGVLAERRGWWAARCPAHETWSPMDRELV
jgi:hypothetical protein